MSPKKRRICCRPGSRGPDRLVVVRLLRSPQMSDPTGSVAVRFHGLTAAQQSTDAPATGCRSRSLLLAKQWPDSRPAIRQSRKAVRRQGRRAGRTVRQSRTPQIRSRNNVVRRAFRFLNEQLQKPMVRNDEKLRLWCLIAKGYTDIEIDYRAAKRDWLEAQDIAKSLGENQWVTRASGELGLIASLEGNPGRAARLLGRSAALDDGKRRHRWPDPFSGATRDRLRRGESPR